MTGNRTISTGVDTSIGQGAGVSGNSHSLANLDIREWNDGPSYSQALAEYQGDTSDDGGGPSEAAVEGMRQGRQIGKTYSYNTGVTNETPSWETPSVLPGPTKAPPAATAEDVLKLSGRFATATPESEGGGAIVDEAQGGQDYKRKKKANELQPEQLQPRPTKNGRLLKGPAATPELARLSGQATDGRNRTIRAERKRQEQRKEEAKKNGEFLPEETLNEADFFRNVGVPQIPEVDETLEQIGPYADLYEANPEAELDQYTMEAEKPNMEDFMDTGEAEAGTGTFRRDAMSTEEEPHEVYEKRKEQPDFNTLSEREYQKYQRTPGMLGQIFARAKRKWYNVDDRIAQMDAYIDTVIDEQQSGQRLPEEVIEETRRRSVEHRFIGDYHAGLLNVEDATVEEEVFESPDGRGRDKYYGVLKSDPEVEALYRVIGSHFGWDAYKDMPKINRLLRLVLGYGADRDLLTFNPNNSNQPGQDPDTAVFKSMVRTGALLIEASMNEAGHPFAFTQANIDHQIGGHPRFPIGIVDDAMIYDLCSRSTSEMYGYEPNDIKIAAKNAWMQTKDQLDSWANHNRDGAATQQAVYDIARAMCHYTEQRCEEFGLVEGSDPVLELKRQHTKFADALTAVDPEHAPGVINKDRAYINQLQIDRRNKARDFVNDRKAAHTGADGKHGKASEQIVNAALATYRTVHIAGDVALAGSAVAEQGKGLAEVAIMNKLYLLNDTDQRMPHHWWKNLKAEGQQELLDATNGLEMLIQAAGGRRDLLIDFAATGQPLTTTNVQEYLKSIMPEAAMPRLEAFTNKFRKISDAIMVGDFATAKPFAFDLINSIMVEESMKEDGITGDMMAEALMSNPIGTITAMAETDELWSAYHRTTNTTYKRISPVIVGLNNLLSRNGIWDLGTAFMFNTGYFAYGVKVLEAWIPGSNTWEYMATYGLVKSGVLDTTALESTLGGLNGSFFKGLKTCMAYDLARFGSTMLQCFAHVAFITAFGGVAPPEEDPNETEEMRQAKLHDYRFWRVKNPFTGQWEAVNMSWYLDDLTQWSVPAAIGIAAALNPDTDFDWADAWKLTANGSLDLLAGNKALGAFQVLADTGKDLINDGTINFDMNPAKEIETRLLKVIQDPMVVSQFHDLLHEGQLERDPFEKLDGSQRTEREAQLNQWALNNDLGGWILNRFTGGVFGWEGSALRTEHDADDEEAAKAASFAQFLKDNPDIEPSDPRAMEAYFNQFKSLVETKGSVAALAANGYRLSKQDAYLLSDYVNDKVSSLYDELDKLALNDVNQYYDSKPGIYAQINELRGWTKDIYYDGVLYNPDQYNVIYNTQVNPGNLRDENGKKVYIDYGDNPSEGLFWTSPSDGTMKDTNDNGYLEHEFRDVFNFSTGQKGNVGDWRTAKYTDDGRTADGRKWIPVDKTKATLTDDQVAEIAAAGFTSSQYQALDYADRLKVDDAIQKARRDKLNETAAASKSGSGGTSWSKNYGGNSYSSKSYSSGGSSSDYSPRIYNMKGGSLSVNKPASMYTKTPYSANKSYLSPDFQTAGSRNAYKRSEY